MSIDSVITSLGGTSAVAVALGLKVTRVSNWKSRNSIPSEHWGGLVDLARKRDVNGITFEALAALHASPVAEPIGGSA